MKYGEIQNLLSVIIGINLAFYAIRELRMPTMSSIRWDADALEKSFADTIAKAEPCSAELKREVRDFNLWIKRRDIRDLAQNTEMLLFGPVCTVVAALAVVLLVVSSLEYNENLPRWLFWTAMAMGFAPVAGPVACNFAATRYLRRYAGKELNKLWREYFNVQVKIDDEREKMRKRGELL